MTADPESHRGDVVDHLHGYEIADPYRWLEDPDSAETTDWVRRQNEVTETELSSYPERPWFQQAMTAILARPRAGVPEQKSGWFFVGRNDGTQAQDVVYVADSLQGLLDGGRVIIDPNQLSEDGTDSLGSFTVSPDGRYFAYGINESGSDWTTSNSWKLPPAPRSTTWSPRPSSARPPGCRAPRRTSICTIRPAAGARAPRRRR